MELERITGPPGTGKTTTISNKVRGYVEDDGVARDKILIASLTRAAAQEAARVVTLPRRQVGTWHSFAYHGLGTPELTEAHIDDWNDVNPDFFLSGGKRDKDAPNMGDGGWGKGDRRMLDYSNYRAMCVPREQWSGEAREFATVWEDWKDQCGYTDFADLIERGLDLDEAPGKPDVILCDEEQDVSLAEARLITHWGQRARRVVLAGDRHQAIYGWRGSDPVAVRDHWESVPVDRAEQTTLRQSYRLSQAVHVQAMWQMRRCVGLDPVDYEPTEHRGFVCRGPKFSNGQYVLEHVNQVARPGETVMFIASCGYMLHSLIKALTDQGEAWHNPWKTNNGKWNPLTSKGTSFLGRCLAFLRPSVELWGPDAQFWAIEDVKAWSSILPASGVFKFGAKTKIANADKQMALKDVAGSMQEWFTPEALEHITNLDIDWLLEKSPQSKKTLSGQLIRQIVTNHGAVRLKEKPRFIIGTVHSLKGSEADIVYVCPDLSSAAVRAARNPRDKAEQYRVFYVALTRAKRALVLCAPSSAFAMKFG